MAVCVHDGMGLPYPCPCLALLTVCLAHTVAYPNWTSSVKVPFPVQCAGKLANLMEKTGLRNVKVHPALRKGFFYL